MWDSGEELSVMADSRRTLLLLAVVLLLGISTPASGDVADAEVSCVFNESCILPCSFQSSKEVEMHWNQVTGNTPVHSYYKQDQLTHQDQRFRGRTSLFKDQISRGNASLQLTRVEVQDQGRYQCYTSTNRGENDSFINLKVDAPVRKVDIQQVGNRITCSSEGIYPEPELTWSTSPPSTETFRNTTTVQKTEQQLYNISSSLILSHSLTDLDFSCNISTRRNWKRETLSKPNPPANKKTLIIVLVVLGCLVIIIIIGFCVYKKKKKVRQEQETHSGEQPNTDPHESIPMMEVRENGGQS